MSSEAIVLTSADDKAGPSTCDEGGMKCSYACCTDLNGTMPATDREVSACIENGDQGDSDDKASPEQLPVSNCVCTIVQCSETSSNPSSNSSAVTLWGELPSPAAVSSERTGTNVMFSPGEDLFTSHNTSSGAGGFVPSPALSGDEAEVDEETGVEESEDERCATPPFPVLSSKPVKGESFCACYQNGADSGLYCTCGEEDSVFEWVWEEKTKSSASLLKQDLREVLFHVDFSCGTAGVRGTKVMKDDQYYWEVKMTTPVYGTDMMVGVGTAEVDLNKYRHMFCSLLGKDSESWGLSYNGFLQHKSLKKSYSSKFGQGTIIGVHLDMWHGALSFFKNRKPLGVAYVGLQGKSIFPMVCSTAARSGMKVIRCRSFKTSLQFMCCQVLRKLVPHHKDVLEALILPPGLRTFLYNNVGWLLQPSPLESPDRCRENVGVRKRNFSEIEEGTSREPTSSKRLCSSQRE